MSDDRSPLETELLSLLAAGRKIEAIQLYRDRSGADLAEAKQAVEGLQRGRSLPRPTDSVSPPPADLEEEVIRLLQDGRKLEAVRAYRERTGLGLKESRDSVEAIARRNHIESRSGCLGVLVAIAVAATGLTALW